MRIPELKTAIADCLDLNIPAFAWGPVGIGKSEGVAAIARERGAAFVDIRLSMFDPVDLRGLPSITDGLTQWARPAIWPTDPTRETILFLDEMDRAPLAVLNAALQLVLDRRIGEHALPDSVRIVAAGNGATDRGTTKLPGASSNRFAHFTAEYDPSATREHFDAIGLNPLIVAFLHLRPALGHIDAMKAEPTLAHVAKSIGNAFPTPRQWERVNKALGLPDARRAAIVRGLLGDSVADEFEAFYRVFRSLPRIADILANPSSAPIPNDPSGLYAVSTAMARAATRANFGDVVAYLKRMPQEFGVMAVTSAVKRDADLKATRPFIDWQVANQDVQL